MTLDYVMLGLLSLGPRTGYDLKKEISRSRVLHWSGNSNQIYRALLGMSEDQLVKMQVVHQEKGPTKKVFSITAFGVERLRAWLKSEPSLPETRSGFLMRLMFSSALDHGETEQMILAYEEMLRVQLQVAAEESRRRGAAEPGSREEYLAENIDRFQVLLLETELEWLRKLRSRLPAG